MEKCQSCEGKGYVEYEGGIIQIQCRECGGTGIMSGEPKYLVLSTRMGEGKSLGALENEARKVIASNQEVAGERITDRSRKDDKVVGSRNTSQPKRSKKREARGKPR